jgi:hypothetical protein
MTEPTTISSTSARAASLTIDAIRDAGYAVRKYSGRFMYGECCVGLIVPRDDSPFSAGVAVSRELNAVAALNDVAFALPDSRTDSMGLDAIVYFPSMAWPDGVDDDDDDDVDDDDEDDDGSDSDD